MVTSGYKWLRAVAKGEFTGLHCDRVFLGRGSPALLTAWLPLGAVPTERGSLLVARGFHRLRAFDGLRGGYGASEVLRGFAVGRHSGATGHACIKARNPWSCCLAGRCPHVYMNQCGNRLSSLSAVRSFRPAPSGGSSALVWSRSRLMQPL